jgi:hypothetical protein
MESVTIDRLASWLTKLGQDVDITITPAPKSRHGRLRVAAAAQTQAWRPRGAWS